MNKVRIYLAGTIYTNPPDNQWKTKFRNELCGEPWWIPDPKDDSYRGVSFQNPMVPDIFEFFDPDPKDGAGLWVVPRDKAEIEKCDILVAYIQKPTVGTSMEIMYASLLNTKTIFVINPNGSLIGNPWIEAHAHSIFDTIQGCTEQIKGIKFG